MRRCFGRPAGFLAASLLAASLLAAGLAAPAAAESPAESWRVACDENFPPYNYVEAGRVVGLDAEIVSAIVRQAGAEPKLLPLPWNRVQQLLEQGDLDAAFQFVGRPERFEKYHMVGPHRSGQTVFAVRQESDLADYGGLAGLRGRRIGMVQGYTYGAAFDTATDLDKDAAAGSNGQLVRMLVAGRVEVIIGDRETLSFEARRAGLRERIRFLPRAFAEVPRYIAVPRTKPVVAARLAWALGELRANGGLAAILRRWE
ncbi:substrate-binding periplasmic protein [Ferrovibrio sp.]|uniref:substrate-binding periplasmic protein n=2 Tax=Ferrovibrio sp. TaxID=1917215 RepID=UPI003510D2EC